MRGSYDSSRLERLKKTWKVMSAVVVVVGTSVAAGVGMPWMQSGDPGVSLPGPEYTIAMAIPARPATSVADVPRQASIVDRGEASFYGAGFAGRPTASGEIFDPSALTAAHPSLPFGARVRVTNQANGKQVTVRINDRGPFAKSRVIDLSEGAAGRIGMINAGTARVVIERV